MPVRKFQNIKEIQQFTYMSNKVLLIGGNFSPELTGIGKYNGEMIAWLSQNGFECTVITTFPYYPQWKVQEPYKKRYFWFKKETAGSSHTFKIIRCPHYIPGNPSPAKRLLSDISILFSSTIALVPILFGKKYNYIFSVAPPFTLGLLGIIYKKIRGAKFLYHIQDLQVNAARDFNMIKSKNILSLLFTIEKHILKHADVISTISRGMMKMIENKCDKKIAYFPNWVDLDEYYPLHNKEELKVKFGFNPSDKLVLYSGAIGEKQGLEAIIHSAKFFEKNTEIKFLICGCGPYKENLVSLKNKFDLKNVFFLPLQPPGEFNLFLNMADVHLILQKANASDLVLPSKLSTVLAIGGFAIVSASPHTSLYEIMESSDMGIVIQPEDQASLDNAILNFIESDNTQKSKNARSYAENFLSIHSILLSFLEEVLNHNSAPALQHPLKGKKVFEPAQ